MSFIPREKLSNKVYVVLKEMIANHRFQPGARLNVEQLAKEMGVSRTPVWQAVSRLEQEGLLQNEPNRGVFMAVLTHQLALDLYAVREVLEGLAGRLAAARIDDKTLTDMQQYLADQVEVIANSDLIGYSRLDFEFHSAVYQACGNPVLQELLAAIKNKMRPLSLQVQPLLSRLYMDHQEIYEALAARDPEKTEQAFRRHNQQMMVLIRSEMQPDNEGRKLRVHFQPGSQLSS